MALFIWVNDLRGRRMAFATALLALASLLTGTTRATGPTPTATGQTAGAPPPASFAGCASPTALCLSNGRFAIEAAWKTSDGSGGVGHPVPLVADSGYFWFFEPNNLEIAVKTLNGCGINGHYWLFAGGLTDVEVTLTVTDNVSGQIRTYTNPLGQVFQPITDIAAFPACSDADTALSIINPEEPPDGSFATMKTFAGARSPDIGCVPSGTALCVGGRFQIEATWQTASGASGPGYAVPLTSEAGYFWFFQPSNLELITKTLDACSIGGGQWFFAAGLTDVGVEMTITDTYTGERKFYSSQLGTPFVPVLDTSAFSCGPLTTTPTPVPTPTPVATPTPTPDAASNTFDVRLETQVGWEAYCCELDLSSGQCLKQCTRAGGCVNPKILPKDITIHAGDTVRWTAGDCAHQIHSFRNRFLPFDEDWGSETISPGSTYERTFARAGIFAYHCSDHGENGVVRVSP